MDRAAFLNSSGGIVTNGGSAIPQFLRPPYVEKVEMPVLSVDSSAIYGDHPELLVTQTISSGGAITFFVDSVAGGNDMSGNGTYENPWRSLNAAYRYLNCNQCVLCAAAAFIQIKVKGIVDYGPPGGGTWSPVRTDRSYKLIIRGWGEQPCDLGTASYDVGYLINISGAGYAYPRRPIVCSDCVLIRGADSVYAIRCSLTSAAGNHWLGIAADCSGGAASARVCWGGNYSGSLQVDYAYAPTVNVSSSVSGGGYVGISAYGVIVSHALVSAKINLSYSVTGSSGAVVSAQAIVGGGYLRYLPDCDVTIAADASGPHAYASAVIAPLFGSGFIITGGSYSACASAFGDGGGSHIYASALAGGVGAAAVSGAQVNCTASAAAIPTHNGETTEHECIFPGTTSHWESRWQRWSSGSFISSGSTSGVS